MTKLFALLALLLIFSGALLLAVPKPPVPERGLAPQAIPAPTMLDQAREIAEQVNAPLSIVFGLISLYYSRRTYVMHREAAGRNDPGLRT